MLASNPVSPPDRRRRQRPLPPEQKTQQQLLDSHLSEVGLTVRVVNALEGAEIYTVHDLTQVSREDLEEMGSFGVITIREIYELLSSLGCRPKWKKPGQRKKQS